MASLGIPVDLYVVIAVIIYGVRTIIVPIVDGRWGGMDSLECVELVIAFILVCSLFIVLICGGIILPIELIASYIDEGEWAHALLCISMTLILWSVVALGIISVLGLA